VTAVEADALDQEQGEGREVKKEEKRIESSQAAIEATARVIEATLGKSKAFRKVEERLYVVRQGSAYVMIVIVPADRRRAIVRLAAQVVTGIEMTGELALRLLRLNTRLRFGAFGYQKEGKVVTLCHSVLGGETLDPEELVAALEDMAMLADEYDDKLVKAGGGHRMQDLLEDEAAASLRSQVWDAGTEWDE
jgi:hypothetical protein